MNLPIDKKIISSLCLKFFKRGGLLLIGTFLFVLLYSIFWAAFFLSPAILYFLALCCEGLARSQLPLIMQSLSIFIPVIFGVFSMIYTLFKVIKFYPRFLEKHW